MMVATLPEHTFLVKLFYENNGNSVVALWELFQGPLTPQALRRVITPFETILRVQTYNCTRLKILTTAVVQQSMNDVAVSSSACAVSRRLDVSCGTV